MLAVGDDKIPEVVPQLILPLKRKYIGGHYFRPVNDFKLGMIVTTYIQ